MSESSGPQEPPAAAEAQEDKDESTMPSAGKQIAVMAIIVVGITVVLGGGVMLSMWLG